MIVRELFSFSNNPSQIRLPNCSVPVFLPKFIGAHESNNKWQLDKRQTRPKKHLNCR